MWGGAFVKSMKIIFPPIRIQIILAPCWIVIYVFTLKCRCACQPAFKNNKSIQCQLTGSISSDYIIEVNARGYRAAELPASIEMVTIPIDYESDNNLLTGSYNGFLDSETILVGSLAELINYEYEMMKYGNMK